MYACAMNALMELEEVDAIVPVLLQRSALMPEVSVAPLSLPPNGRGNGA